MIQFETPFKEPDNLQLLESFKHLQDDWNGYGAKAFSKAFIERIKEIVSGLDKSPKIFPTGRNSVQLEYEKDNGDYLEFEVYENGEIHCFKIVCGLEKEEVIIANQIDFLVKEFHAHN